MTLLTARPPPLPTTIVDYYSIQGTIVDLVKVVGIETNPSKKSSLHSYQMSAKEIPNKISYRIFRGLLKDYTILPADRIVLFPFGFTVNRYIYNQMLLEDKCRTCNSCWICYRNSICYSILSRIAYLFYIEKYLSNITGIFDKYSKFSVGNTFKKIYILLCLKCGFSLVFTPVRYVLYTSGMLHSFHSKH